MMTHRLQSLTTACSASPFVSSVATTDASHQAVACRSQGTADSRDQGTVAAATALTTSPKAKGAQEALATSPQRTSLRPPQNIIVKGTLNSNPPPGGTYLKLDNGTTIRAWAASSLRHMSDYFGQRVTVTGSNPIIENKRNRDIIEITGVKTQLFVPAEAYGTLQRDALCGCYMLKQSGRRLFIDTTAGTAAESCALEAKLATLVDKTVTLKGTFTESWLVSATDVAELVRRGPPPGALAMPQMGHG